MKKQIVGQPRYLKEINLNIVNNLLNEKGPLTKPQIAEQTGLSLPTVNKIVDLLEKENKIHSIGMTGHGAGRRAQLYQTNGNFGNMMTAYVSQGVTTCCVVNMLGDVIYRFSVNLTGEQDPTEGLCQAIERMKQNCSSQPVAIGIGVPGAVDTDGVLSNIPAFPQWEGVNLAEHLAEKFQIPVCTANNSQLTAIGYYDTQLKSRCRDAVYIQIGKDISSGIILGAKLHTGFANFAGELNYMMKTDLSEGSGSLADTIGHYIRDYELSKNSAEAAENRDKINQCLVGVVVSHICIINPQAVVFRGAAVTKDLIDELKEKVEMMIPEKCMPEFLIDNSELSGIRGIVEACHQILSPSIYLVKEG